MIEYLVSGCVTRRNYEKLLQYATTHLKVRYAGQQSVTVHCNYLLTQNERWVSANHLECKLSELGFIWKYHNVLGRTNDLAIWWLGTACPKFMEPVTLRD